MLHHGVKLRKRGSEEHTACLPNEAIIISDRPEASFSLNASYGDTVQDFNAIKKFGYVGRTIAEIHTVALHFDVPFEERILLPRVEKLRPCIQLACSVGYDDLVKTPL